MLDLLLTLLSLLQLGGLPGIFSRLCLLLLVCLPTCASLATLRADYSALLHSCVVLQFIPLAATQRRTTKVLLFLLHLEDQVIRTPFDWVQFYCSIYLPRLHFTHMLAFIEGSVSCVQRPLLSLFVDHRRHPGCGQVLRPFFYCSPKVSFTPRQIQIQKRMSEKRGNISRKGISDWQLKP